MKKTLILRIILFLITLISFFGTAVFAWSAFAEKTQPIMFYSGRLKVDAKLYFLADPNYDGEDSNNIYHEINSEYTFPKLIPGQIFTFKLDIKNLGNIPGNLSIKMFLNELSNPEFLDTIDIRYINPTLDNESITTSIKNEFLFFENKVVLNATSQNPNINQETLYFNIIVKPSLGNSLSNINLVIKTIEIRLDQILTNQ